VLIQVANLDSESVRQYYCERDRDLAYERQWGYTNPVSGGYWRMRDELVAEAIINHFDPLKRPMTVLEIGVGYGHELAKFSLLGIPNTQLIGLDLVPERLRRAGELYPSLQFARGDARDLPFPDACFDVVCQFTCVMHAGSKESQRRICQEMARVLKPGGVILWWDVAPARWRNVFGGRLVRLLFGKQTLREKARSVGATFRDLLSAARRRGAARAAEAPHVLPAAAEELHAWFAGLKVRARPAGLDYPLWETVWRKNRTLAQALWRSGWFSRHCFAVIEKAGPSAHPQAV
jgi:SAM-dependent methyltransferase